MISRSDWVEACRALVGTPWHHAGRCPGHDGGIDCAGVPALAAKALALPHKDRIDYGAGQDNYSKFCEGLEPLAEPWDGDPEDADIVAIRIHRVPLHILIPTPDGTMVHVRFDERVVEEPWRLPRLSMVRGMWVLKGVPR